MSFSRKRETHGFLTHNRSCRALKTHQKGHQKASFLPYNFSRKGSKGRLYDPDKQENVWFAAWKRFVSGRARKTPFLPLNYRDTRTVMIQNAKGIKSNNTLTQVW
jgi:hypothetical protein